MTDTLTIPAEAIDSTREAVLCLLNDPVQNIDWALGQQERELHPEWFAAPRQRFQDVCRLLDLIGWDSSNPPASTEVPTQEAHTLADALRQYLPIVEQWLHEAERLGVQRKHRDSVQRLWALLKSIPDTPGAGEPLPVT